MNEIDRIATRASWLLIVFGAVYIALQIVRMARLWPF
jgi:hypothetical protein